MRKPLVSSAAIVRFLGQLPLFHDLDVPVLTALVAASRVETYPKGEYIFLQSDPAEAAYLVLSGSVAIVLSSLDGREMVINEMVAGDCFGELALLTDNPRSTGAMARARSEIISIPRQAFLAVLGANPRLAWHLLEITAERLNSSSERESALAFLDARARLGRVLVQLDKQGGERGAVKISQEELAQRTGLTRQTVAAILGKWRRSGWVITGRGYIMLLKVDALTSTG